VVQVVCADVIHQPTFFQDDLVQNYLQFAHQRFNELNSVRRRQCDEMRRRLSTDIDGITRLMAPQQQHLPTN